MSEPCDVVHRLVAAINDHDLDAALRCYSPRAAAVGPQGVADGREEIGFYHSHVWEGFPDLRLTVWETVQSGDLVVVESTVTGTNTGVFLLPGGEVADSTGKGISVRHCWVFTVESAEIVAQRVYYDQLEMYSQLGARLVLEDPPPHGAA
jgi:limonene-1,2-epoxide hydrolase